MNNYLLFHFTTIPLNSLNYSTHQYLYTDTINIEPQRKFNLYYCVSKFLNITVSQYNLYNEALIKL